MAGCVTDHAVGRRTPRNAWPPDSRVAGRCCHEGPSPEERREGAARSSESPSPGRKVAVTTTKQSLAITDRAWFRTNVLHACVPCLAGGGRDGMYRLTARGDTRIPSFTRSSAASRSSPHVRFAAAIVAMSCCKSTVIGSRPGARDVQCQNNRNPFRCHQMSVSGCTTVSS